MICQKNFVLKDSNLILQLGSSCSPIEFLTKNKTILNVIDEYHVCLIDIVYPYGYHDYSYYLYGCLIGQTIVSGDEFVDILLSNNEIENCSPGYLNGSFAKKLICCR